MEKRANELKARYKKTLAEELYLNKNIEYSPRTDYIFVKGSYSFGGYYEGTLRKAIISDVDDTLTIGETLAKKWIDRLSGINRQVGENHEELLDYLSKIPFVKNFLEIKEIVDAFGKKLSKCKLRYEEYQEAATYSADETNLTPYSRELVSGLERMGYVVSLNSGSPKECVELLGERLGIPKRWIGWFGVHERVFGSRYRFENGYFTGVIEPGLDFNKKKGMDDFLEKVKCPHSLSVFMSDDPDSDKLPATEAGCAIWVDLGKNSSLTEESKRLLRKFGRAVGLYELPGKISIYCPEARENMRVLLDYIRRWDLLNVVVYLRTPESERELYNLAKRFKNITESGLRAREDFQIYRNEFLILAHQILSVVEPIVTEKSLNVFGRLLELESCNDTERDKSLMKDIFSSFNYRIPEIQAPEKFGEELNSIVDERQLLKNPDWWLP